MDGSTRKAGAVAALQGFQSPIQVARAVMDRTSHVMLAGEGAAAFAAEQGLARIEDVERWLTRDIREDESSTLHGTVGCVVRDAEGRLAAATSTGGTYGKLPGRVGDTPVIGAGTWADDRVAVSCTGVGEYFLRTAAAVQLAMRLQFGEWVAEAADAVLGQIAALGGDGGLIAVTADGELAMPWNSEGMKRAWLTADGEIGAAAF
jgi:beta-aspartyl-peptidase (threonine type)